MFDLQFIVLGLIQGITEFLPISSSAHLILISNIFNWKDQGLFNDIAVHFGTLGAVIYYLRKDLVNIFLEIIFLKRTKIKEKENHLFKIILATLPAILIGFIVFKYFVYELRNLIIIAYSNIIFGIILYFVDKYSKSINEWHNLNFKNYFYIGLFQCFAFIPGASRAGVTITGARLMGIKRDSAAIFSMLLSVPIILASISLSFIDLFSSLSIKIDILSTIISTLVAFLTALISINFMMKIIQKTNFTIFIVYRVLLGIIILIGIY